jgi:putative aldouronate transport system permease protein
MGAKYIVNSIFVSFFTTIVGTLVSMLISVAAGYALSKKNLPGRNIIFSFVIFTMFFSGGLIPYYLIVKAVGLVNNILVLVVPMAVNTFNVILLKNYFTTVPPSLEESAKIDGANDIYILWRIILPTSMPIIATVSLFYAVERWNEWWHALLFIQSRNLQPLQMVLREVLFNFDQAIASSIGRSIAQSKKFTYARSVQMAIVVVATVPILLVYPYLQKHFTKGIMLGSIKE